jgi:hypothetical protein
MIVVTVTEHEGIEPGRINPYEVGIVDHRFWREAEIHQDITSFRTAPRLGEHREAELTDQGLAWWRSRLYGNRGTASGKKLPEPCWESQQVE